MIIRREEYRGVRLSLSSMTLLVGVGIGGVNSRGRVERRRMRRTCLILGFVQVLYPGY